MQQSLIKGELQHVMHPGGNHAEELFTKNLFCSPDRRRMHPASSSWSACVKQEAILLFVVGELCFHEETTGAPLFLSNMRAETRRCAVWCNGFRFWCIFCKSLEKKCRFLTRRRCCSPPRLLNVLLKRPDCVLMCLNTIFLANVVSYSVFSFFFCQYNTRKASLLYK